MAEINLILNNKNYKFSQFIKFNKHYNKYDKEIFEDVKRGWDNAPFKETPFCHRLEHYLIGRSFGKHTKKETNIFWMFLKHKYRDKPEYYERCLFNNFKDRVRSRTKSFFNRIKINKPCKTEKLLGADWLTVKMEFEKKFKDGMNWDNMGLWHIDHIIPLASVNNEQDAIKLCHHTNLQPLWAKDNLTKKSKYNGKMYNYKSFKR